MNKLTRIKNESEWYIHCANTMFPDKTPDTVLFTSCGTGWEGKWDKGETITVQKMVNYYLTNPESYPLLVHIAANRDDSSWGGGWDCSYFEDI